MVSLTNVTKRYKGRIIINKLNLSFQKGIYSIRGENGSGKSTLLKIISGYDLKFHGKIEKKDLRIFYLPEKLILPKSLTVKQFLYFFMQINNGEESISYYLKRYHLDNKAIGNLSKGMTQKVGIVSMLVADFDLYLLDEPLEGLDDESIKLFEEDISMLKDKTVIIAEHKNRLLHLDAKVIELGECNK